MWDLQRNGNNVQMTTERVLAGRRLETVSYPMDIVKEEKLITDIQPPQSFQPILPQETITVPSTRATPAKSTQPDLIKRYNLDSKLQSAEAIEKEQATKPVWSANKTDRQTSLQKRREEMILAARRKLQQKEASSS
jgi:coupling of ubiquitin conjugation to ER degradation protein 1